MADDRNLTPFVRPRQELGDALLDVIRVRGTTLFTEILLRRATQAKQAPGLARGFLRRAMEQMEIMYGEIRETGIRQVASDRWRTARETTEAGVRQARHYAREAPRTLQASVTQMREYYLSLPTPAERTEFVVTWVFYVMSFLGGVALGFRTPLFDLALSPKRAKDRIILHSFPLLALEVSLEWFHRILDETSRAAGLSPTDQRRLRSLRQIVKNLSGGVATGAATREWRKNHLSLRKSSGREQRGVSLDAHAYRYAESLFRSLTKMKPPPPEGTPP